MIGVVKCKQIFLPYLHTRMYMLTYTYIYANACSLTFVWVLIKTTTIASKILSTRSYNSHTCVFVVFQANANGYFIALPHYSRTIYVSFLVFHILLTFIFGVALHMLVNRHQTVAYHSSEVKTRLFPQFLCDKCAAAAHSLDRSRLINECL